MGFVLVIELDLLQLLDIKKSEVQMTAELTKVRVGVGVSEPW